MGRTEKIEMMRLMQERLNRESRSDLLRFTFSTMPTFKPADFHRRYYAMLTKFAMGQIKKLMVFMPPQHGKSEGSTRRLPAFLLGLDPDKKLAVVSYNAPKARKFNREIQRIIDTAEYHAIFPQTTLNASAYADVESDKGVYMRNADECEIVGHRGGFKTVGVGGALTGEPVDILIMDDIYKDAKTAWSPIVRESVSDWYDTVAETRLHNNSQQLIVFTRWHEDDLAGSLLRQQGVYSAENKNGWVVVVYQAIKEGAPTEYDPRNEGEPLWEERHNLEKLQLIRSRNPQVFESLYQQDPQPRQGLMYENGFVEYDIRPASKTVKRRCYVDVADTGEDYLCAIVYDETEAANYVVDVIYTTKPVEYTQTALANMLTKYGVADCVIEANNGGRLFKNEVERQCRLMNNGKTHFTAFHQTENKDLRIYSHSAMVQNLTFMPRGWKKTHPDFAKAVCGYLKAGKNDHDDAVDALTGTIEKRKGEKKTDVAALFGR